MAGGHDVSARRPVTSVRVRAVAGDDFLERPDQLVTEEPLEIRVQGPRGDACAVAVTMRTPGHDFELAVGFLLSEGVLAGTRDLVSVAYCMEDEAEQHYNVVTVRTRAEPRLDPAARRFVMSSSCGVCGRTSLDQIEAAAGPVGSGPVVARSMLVALPARLRAAQTVFDATGGLHAAACFGVDGSLTVLREDVGRHNALDKVVGRAAIAGTVPLADQVLLVSGRLSFEIVQKAAVGGIPVVCAVSAPSSLAVQAAERLGQTVVGFLRDERFNVYCGAERIDTAA